VYSCSVMGVMWSQLSVQDGTVQIARKWIFVTLVVSPFHNYYGQLAQSVERGANNATVAGSIPALTNELFFSLFAILFFLPFIFHLFLYHYRYY
jgi:hypothetical protein